MSRHTAAPWVAKELGGYMTPGWVILHEAKPGHMTRLDYKGGLTRYDAALIAAAPDLLRALDRLQANPNDPAAHREALDVMRKARGLG